MSTIDTTVCTVQCTTVKRRFARILQNVNAFKTTFYLFKKTNKIIIMTPKTIYDQRLFSKDNISGYY